MLKCEKIKYEHDAASVHSSHFTNYTPMLDIGKVLCVSYSTFIHIYADTTVYSRHV